MLRTESLVASDFQVSAAASGCFWGKHGQTVLTKTHISRLTFSFEFGCHPVVLQRCLLCQVCCSPCAGPGLWGGEMLLEVSVPEVYWPVFHKWCVWCSVTLKRSKNKDRCFLVLFELNLFKYRHVSLGGSQDARPQLKKSSSRPWVPHRRYNRHVSWHFSGI